MATRAVWRSPCWSWQERLRAWTAWTKVRRFYFIPEAFQRLRFSSSDEYLEVEQSTGNPSDPRGGKDSIRVRSCSQVKTYIWTGPSHECGQHWVVKTRRPIRPHRTKAPVRGDEYGRYADWLKCVRLLSHDNWSWQTHALPKETCRPNATTKATNFIFFVA